MRNCVMQAPFNTEEGKLLLGKLDLAFLGAYAVGMFGAGHLGDRIHLRKFLAMGMLASAAMVCAFGSADFLEIHSIWYFVSIQAIGGNACIYIWLRMKIKSPLHSGAEPKDLL